MSLAWRALRPIVFGIEPETAHRLSINALKCGLHPRPTRTRPALQRRLLGLDFPNPFGTAAGYDKNAEVPDALLSLGFGFVEVGTVTPRPQTGNPAPRVFRLVRDGALINRLGFPSEGHEAVYRRLAARERRGIVGVNIGANKDSPDRIADYVAGVTRFADVADYIAVNVSSPNTPGLRDLQEKRALGDLLARVVAARDAGRIPLLLKIAPDLDDNALAIIAETALASGIDGMIATNTTVAREKLQDLAQAKEAGGLSGRPLFERSTAVLARLRRAVGRDMVLIGAGGIDSAAAAVAKIRAGADLVQLYTGLVFDGPDLPARLLAEVPPLLAGTIADMVGVDADRWSETT
jgi:dihydroorotate dehydrogenase